MNIDLLEPVRLGGNTRWIRIRGANTSNPLLLLVQMGPGLPMINEARAFGRLLSLEDDFTVVYWDQRGCGRSLRSPDATRDLSLQAMLVAVGMDIDGAHDQAAPAAPAERYAALLEAPGKQLVWFEHSAHMPHLEEPGRFRQLLAQVRLGLPAKT